MESTTPDVWFRDSSRRQASPSSPASASGSLSMRRSLAEARTPLEALQQRISRQMERLRTECEQAASSTAKRFEARLAAVEAPQKKMEQRLLEVCGRCEHLFTSVKQQAERMDLSDKRATQWRRQAEETAKAQQADIDRRFQGMSTSSACSTKATEESLAEHRKRISACEECLEENLRHGQEFGQALANLSCRLAIMERGAGFSDEGMQERLISVEEQLKLLQAKSWPTKFKLEAASLVQHSDTGGCGSGDEVIAGPVALSDDDHPAWKWMMSRLSTAETQIQDLSNTVAEVHADAKLGPELSMLVKHLQEIAPKVIEHERQLRMHSAADGSFVQSLAEECKQRISQIEAGSQADRSKIHKLGVQHDEHQRSSETVVGRVSSLEATCVEAKEAVNALRGTWEQRFTQLENRTHGQSDGLEKKDFNAVVAERRESEAKLLQYINEVRASSVEKKAWEAEKAERKEAESRLLHRIEAFSANFLKNQVRSLDAHRHEAVAAALGAPADARTPSASHGGKECSWFFNAAMGGTAASQEFLRPGDTAQHILNRIEEHCTWLERLHWRTSWPTLAYITP